MPKKKKASDSDGAPVHPALVSDEGPERKTLDDLIVDDPQTQLLLLALLGKWRDVPEFEEYYRRKLDDALHLAEIRWTARYMIGDYYACPGEKPAMTWSEIEEAWRRRRESAAGRLEAIIGDRIKARLLEALDEAARMAADAEVDAIERRIKSAQAKRKAKFTRTVKKHLVAPMTGESYHFGRPSETKRDEVERRSVEIIRAIGAGPGDLCRVAVVFKSNMDCSTPDAATVARQTWNQTTQVDRKRARDAYVATLKRRGLDFAELVERANKMVGDKGLDGAPNKMA